MKVDAEEKAKERAASGEQDPKVAMNKHKWVAILVYL